MDKSYFHCAPVMLSPGSVVEPGNWGRIIRAYRPDAQGNVAANAYRELLLEAVRKRVAPEKPSRMACVFACQNEAELQAFMAGRSNVADIAYEVAPIGVPPLHVANHDLPLFRTTAGQPYFDLIESQAEAYWCATPPSERLEVLIGGPVRVIRRLA